VSTGNLGGNGIVDIRGVAEVTKLAGHVKRLGDENEQLVALVAFLAARCARPIGN
jgi:hypothetical protein